MSNAIRSNMILIASSACTVAGQTFTLLMAMAVCCCLRKLRKYCAASGKFGLQHNADHKARRFYITLHVVWSGYTTALVGSGASGSPVNAHVTYGDERDWITQTRQHGGVEPSVVGQALALLNVRKLAAEPQRCVVQTTELDVVQLRDGAE